MNRAVGALVAAGTSLAVATLEELHVLGQLAPWAPSHIGLLGLPGAALLGWCLGPAVSRSALPEAIWLGITIGIAVEPLGVMAVLFTAVIDSPGRILSNPVQGITAFPILCLLGAAFGIVVTVVTVPAGLACAVLVRAIARLRALPVDDRASGRRAHC